MSVGQSILIPNNERVETIEEWIEKDQCRGQMKVIYQQTGRNSVVENKGTKRKRAEVGNGRRERGGFVDDIRFFCALTLT